MWSAEHKGGEDDEQRQQLGERVMTVMFLMIGQGMVRAWLVPKMAVAARVAHEC
jgi:hypothetical protein